MSLCAELNMMHCSRRSLLRYAVGLAAATWAMGASAHVARAGTQTLRFRVLHAVPDAGELDIYVSRTRVASDLSYTRFSRTWTYPAPSLPVRVFFAGDDPATTAPLLATNVPAELGRSYLIAIANRLSNLQALAFPDPPHPPRGQFALRFMHLAPSAGMLDLLRADTPTALSTLAFGEAQSILLPAGTYAFQVRDASTGVVYLSLPARRFAAGARRTLYVFEQARTGARALAQADGLDFSLLPDP